MNYYQKREQELSLAKRAEKDSWYAGIAVGIAIGIIIGLALA